MARREGIGHARGLVLRWRGRGWVLIEVNHCCGCFESWSWCDGTWCWTRRSWRGFPPCWAWVAWSWTGCNCRKPDTKWLWRVWYPRRWFAVLECAAADRSVGIVMLHLALIPVLVDFSVSRFGAPKSSSKTAIESNVFGLTEKVSFMVRGRRAQTGSRGGATSEWQGSRHLPWCAAHGQVE